MVSPPLRRGGDSEHRLLHISDFLKWAQKCIIATKNGRCESARMLKVCSISFP